MGFHRAEGTLLNVLQLISGRSFTGAAAAALTDARALRAAGHGAWLASRSGGALERGCAEAGIGFVGGFHLARGALGLMRLPADRRRLREVARDLNLDVVHVHRSDDQLLAWLALKGLATTAVVRTWHRDPAESSRLLMRQMLKACAGYVCVARAHAEALRARGARVAEYLPPGVDTERFRPRTGGAALAPRTLGQIGRWKAVEDRGQGAFLEVARRLEVKLDWQAVLLGRGEGRSDLQGQVAAHPARERLRLVEASADFPAQVAELDLGLVFAAGSDGTSRPALELLAAGVPVLLADLPGLRELGEDPACARVLPPHDFDAWARACGELLAGPSQLGTMKTAARRRAEQVHALPVRGAALAKFYGGLRAGKMEKA